MNDMQIKEAQFSYKNVTGVIGHPIRHSFSPLMHNSAFKALGLDFIYLPFDVLSENLQDALKGMIALNIKGFNVTLPHKEKILQYLNDVTDEANVIGAVNTVVNVDGNLVGHNTDVDGVVASLNNFKNEISGSEVAILGCGGAARSVIYAFISHFKVAKINLINRTLDKAESVKDYYAEKMLFENIETFELMPPDLKSVLKRSKVVVNATSVGMFPETDDSPLVTSEGFNEEQIVFDLVYNPLRTRFLELAEEAGARTINGLNMFVHQGAKSFELWTNHKMPLREITQKLETELKKVNEA